MPSTIQFNIRGNKPPFVVDLRQTTVDGTILQTVNLPVSGASQFTLVPDGNYYIVVNDIGNNAASYAVNIAAPPTTTTTTTTTTTLAPTGQYIIGGENRKLNISTNLGVSWVDVTPTFTPVGRLHAISLIENVGYAHGNGRLLYKTTDGGFNWTDISSSVPLALPANNNGMYAVTENVILLAGGISETNFYRSSNGGSSFSTIPKGITMGMSKFEFTSPNVGYVINVFPTIGGGAIIAKTNDGGISWTNITPPIMLISKTYIDISFFGNTGYVVTGSDVIFKTTDGGSTWTSITQPLDTFAVGVKAISNTDVIVVGTNNSVNINKLCKSTNGGSSWTITNISATGNGQILTAPYYGKAFEMVSATHGIVPLFDTTSSIAKTIVTTDGGNTWGFGGNTTLIHPDNYWAIAAKRPSFI